VAEAAVVGVPDDRRGEVPARFIVRVAGAQMPETSVLEAHCRAQLASFKIPRAFVIVDQLRETPLGKVQKALLPKERARQSP